MFGTGRDEKTLEEVPSEIRNPSGHDDLHIVLECDRPLAGSTRHCIDDIDQISFRRGRQRRFARELVSGVRKLTLEVPDPHMSSTHATMRRLDGRWLLEDTNSRNGSYLQGRRVDRVPLADRALMQFGHTYFLLRSRELPRMLVERTPDLTSASGGDRGLGTVSHELGAVLARMLDASRAGVAVLLVGEAGSGKDTIARAVHALASDGGAGAFAPVQCALLGHGGDPGHADDVPAQLARAFEHAAGGTLFLNEIDGLSPTAQVALLSALRSPARTRIARILSSVRSNDLRSPVPALPADLLADVAGFWMSLPPLRDRLEDMGTLVSDILGRAGPPGEEPPLRIDMAMGQALLLHDWPYNISELESTLRFASTQSTQSGAKTMHWSPPALLYARSSAPARLADSEPPIELGTVDTTAVQATVDTRSGPDAEFAKNVRRALKCHLSLAGLQTNGLLGSDMVLEAANGSVAATSTVPALREAILSSLDSLRKSSPRGERQGRVIHLTFIEPASTQQEVADRLAMAFGTYRRYVTSALAELTSILWFRELSARVRRAGSAAPRPAANDAAAPAAARSR
jgi:hypothetical protein